VALLLSDHDGPLDRRDAAGAGALVIALAFASPALTMVAVVAVNALWRRRWATLALYTGITGAVYAVWYLRYGRGASRMPVSWSGISPFVWRALTSAVDGLSQLPGAAVLVILVALLDLARRGRDGRLNGLVVACTAGALLFFVSAGISRASLGVEQAAASRYVYIAAPLLMPALVALLTDLVEALGTAGRVVVAGLVAWAFIGNLSAGVTIASGMDQGAAALRLRLAATAALPSFTSLQPDRMPESVYTPDLDFKALQDFIANDHLVLPAVDPAAVLATAAILQVGEGSGTAGAPGAASVAGVDGTTATPEGSCVRLRNPGSRVIAHVRSDQRTELVLSDTEGPVSIRLFTPDGQAAASAVGGANILVDHPDYPLEIRLPFPRALLCGAHVATPG
jgi:hypothetical protein